MDNIKSSPKRLVSLSRSPLIHIQVIDYTQILRSKELVAKMDTRQASRNEKNIPYVSPCYVRLILSFQIRLKIHPVFCLHNTDLNTP